MKAKLDKILDSHTTHWQWYKGFFNITVFRYLVTWFAIVPIILKLVENADPSLKVKDIVEIHIVNNASLPFSLQILWVSSLLFVIALFLYHIFCPGFIKTYSSYADYLKHHHSPRWIIWETQKVVDDKNEIDKLFERLNEKGYVSVHQNEIIQSEVKIENAQTVIYFKHNGQNYKMGLPIVESGNEAKDKTAIAEREIFWEVFGRFSSSKKYIRLAILILLIISGLLFAWTLIEHIWTGLKYIIQ